MPAPIEGVRFPALPGIAALLSALRRIVGIQCIRKIDLPPTTRLGSREPGVRAKASRHLLQELACRANGRWRRGKEFVERAAFGRFEMRERNVAKAFNRHDMPIPSRTNGNSLRGPIWYRRAHRRRSGIDRN